MTAMDVLAACRRACQECARLTEMIADITDGMTAVKIGQGMGGGGSGDKMAVYAARKDELQRRLKDERRWLAAGRQAVILLTGNLPELPRKCLRAFYGDALSAPKIAEREHYSDSSVYKALAAGRAAMRMIPDREAEEALPPRVRREWAEGGVDE